MGDAICVAGNTYTTYVRLVSQSTGQFQAAPTIGADDFNISINGAASTALDNTPTVAPAGGTRVQIILSVAETTAAAAGGVITVDCIDDADDEWDSVGLTIPVHARDISDLAFPNTSGRGIDVSADGGVEVESLNTQAKADVNAEVDTALADYDPPTKAELDAGLAALNDPTAAEIWTYSVRTLTQAGVTADNITTEHITKYRGDTWIIPLTGLGSIAGRTDIFFSLKNSIDDEDTAALVRISKDGLARINGAAAAEAGNGSIAVDDQDLGNITITVHGTETAKLTPKRSLFYDVKVLEAGGPRTIAAGLFNISGDITRATS